MKVKGKYLNFCVTKKIAVQVHKIRSEGFVLERRVSPRLKSIPKDKRPYYGSKRRRRRRIYASKDVICTRKTGDKDQKRQSDSPEHNAGTDKAKVDVTARKNLTRLVPKIRSEGLLLERRVSPRLKHISADKRPYYGCVQRRRSHASKDPAREKETKDSDWKRQLASPKDNAGKDQTKADITMTRNIVQRVWKRQLASPKDNAGKDQTKADITMTRNIVQRVQKMKSDRCFLERRVSPRLKNIPANKRPFYGGNQRRQLGANKDELCDRKNKDDDRMMLLHSLDDNANEQKTKVDHTMQDNANEQKTEVDHTMQKCLLDAGRKDEEDRGTESDFTLGFASIGHDDTAIMNLEDGVYLEWTSCESFLDDSIYQMSGARGRETVLGLMAVSPLLLTYEGSINERENSSKEETDDEAFDVTMRNKIVQQLQKIKSKVLLLERRVSPRFKDIPKEKRPYYGSNQTGQFNSTKGYICDSNDRKRQLYFPKDNTTKKKTKIDHSMQDCLPNVSRKDISRQDSESRLVPISGSVKYEKRELLDLANGAFLKSMDCKRFLADHMYQEAGARVKQTVKALSTHHPCLVQDCFERERAFKDPSKLPGLVCEDISYGVEDIPIPVTNMIDPPIVPAGFKYTNSIQVARNVSIPQSPSGCNCKGSCTNPKSCSCARLNGSDFPYVHKDGGRLIEPKDVVFECGPGCGCGPNCINRISQKGLKYQLEVYRTRKKGWAVRSWDFIPSGASVLEYTGVLRRSAELDNVSQNDFIFEIDCWHTMHGIGGRERRQGDVSVQARNLVEKVDEAESESEFCIDGGSSGNVTRFINHSCEPNLFVQCILSSHYDIRLARIVLFAADDIPPMQELTYDYGYELDSVIGPDGKLKKSPCYCGTSECRGRLY